MTKRKQYLFIAIWLAAITLMFVLWQYAFAQRRQISYQDWLPLVRQEKEPATPVKGIGLVYIDPNWNLTYKDIFERISVFAGPNITYNISNLAIDGNTIYIDGDNNSIGFFTTTPAAEAGIQYSDKFVICDTFTSAGVQACVDQLSTDGGQVILPEGDYLWSSRVYKGNTYHNIQIIGSGSGTCISPDPNNLWGYESGWKVGDYFNINGDNCSVSNLKFDGLNENAVTSSYLIYLGGDNCKVDRVHVYRCDPTNYGLISVDDYGQVTNCFFYYNRDGNAGINLEGNHSIASNNIFYDNLFYYGGIYSYWQRNISIINNIFYDEDDECIGIYGGYGSNISNNVMYNVKTGISCGYKAGSNASYNVTIKNNHIILAEAYGITLDAVQNFQIENNYIYDTDPNGIDILLGSTYYSCLSFFGSISGNYLSGIRDSSKNNSSDCGIKILGGSDFKINDNYIGYHKLYGIYAGPTSGGSYEQNQTRNIQISSNKINAQYGSNSFYTNSIYIDPNTENVSIWGNEIYDPNNIAPIYYGDSQISSFQAGKLLLWTHQTATLADDGTVNLPDATDGMVFVSITDPNSAFTDESGMWMVTNTGVVSKVSGTTNTDDADTDATLCVYDGGTYGIIKNRLGGVGTLRAFYFYQ